MRVSVFGMGYVGCVSAACLAEAGHEVVGVDPNAEKVATINAGKSPIVEPGLGELIEAGRAAGRLRATSDAENAVASSDLALISVGTPSRPNGRLDVDAVVRVCREIGWALRKHRKPYTVVVRSTVLPGTTEDLLWPALSAAAGDTARLHLRIAVNPEFLREGTALRDYAAPPYTLAGCDDDATASLLRALYAGVDAPFMQTEIRNAEMVKYACNAFHALKVCFANEIGDVCEALAVDAQEVMRIFRMDRKLNVSDAYLRPGFAFGGSCLPKDLRALLHIARSADLPVPLLGAILPSNECQQRRPLESLLALRRKRIGVVGLSFKPGTDDLRESPLVTLVEALIGKGCDVKVFDPHVAIARLTGANRRYIEEEIPHIASLMCEREDELLAHAEVLVIGNSGEAAVRIMAAARPEQVVVDLMRGAAGTPRARPTEVQSPWPTSKPSAVRPRPAVSSPPSPSLRA